jgi:hypothetical protein
VPKRIRGHSFAFTGKIEGQPRERVLYPLIERYDGRVFRLWGIKSADCLVHGAFSGDRKTTQKLIAARAAGIEIIYPAEFELILETEKRRRRP